MRDPRKIRLMIRANAPELEGFGTLSVRRAESTGGRPGTAFYLNEEQALLICMLSRTPTANEIRRKIIQDYQAWRQRAVNRFEKPTLDQESRGRDNDVAEFRGRAACLDQ